MGYIKPTDDDVKGAMIRWRKLDISKLL
jgi:hypothetical protein